MALTVKRAFCSWCDIVARGVVWEMIEISPSAAVNEREFGFWFTWIFYTPSRGAINSILTGFLRVVTWQ
jgi:hypothetical protein